MRGEIVSRILFHCQDTLVHNDKLWVQSCTQRQTMLHFSDSRTLGESSKSCKFESTTTNYASGQRQTIFPVTKSTTTNYASLF
jgi:hypothetical protein